jgi:hypothetical protein
MCKLTPRGLSDETSYVYGETPEVLGPAVGTYLLYEKKLVRFHNVGDHLTGRLTYFYSDGMATVDTFQKQPLETGWWYQKETLIRGRLEDVLRQPPVKLNSFEDAIDHFVAHALIPERGPDYQSKAMVGNELRLPLLEKILREAEEHSINDLIQRGWQIIAQEYKGELSITGELMTRKAIFVLGHADSQAATFTLNTDYYKQS